ncbi:MAG: hypothetical protein Q8R54_02835, partial [Methylobacter sp.]|nr:hypothetical protein [Methylobacter sp.]
YVDTYRHITLFVKNYSVELNIGGTKKVPNPTSYDIKSAIKSTKNRNKKKFVILGKGASGYTFLQAYLEDEGTWTVEYQDGHLDKHFSAIRTISEEETLRIFSAYSEAVDNWRDEIEWVPLDLPD